jgi:hypothetical protein
MVWPTQTTRDPLMLAYWEQILNGLVYELYFPEEVHGAGLHFFYLVEQAQLADLEKRVAGAHAEARSREEDEKKLLRDFA